MPSNEAVEMQHQQRSTHVDAEAAGLEEVDGVYRSTQADAQAMNRMGRSQELVRHYRLFSLVSFVVVATSAWQLTLFQVTPALLNGGAPALLWSYLWCFVGFVPIILSMAEMASMAPIAGAQYHWVSEFAPERYQKFLSYMTGWLSTLAWQSGNTQGIFLLGTLIQSIILINNPDYAFPNWHATVIAIGVTIVSVPLSIYGTHIIPYLQNALFALALAAYVGFLIPIWINAPVVPSSDVWTKWEFTGGWESTVLAVFIAQLPAITARTGVDTAAHMSEEVKNASMSVPRVMIIIFIVNFLQTFITSLTLVYHIPSIEESLLDPSTYPAIYVIKQSMSTAWVTVLLTIICALLWVGVISYLAAVSRDLYAFSRDNGLPYSAWIAKIDPKLHTPTNAYIFSGVFACIFSLIYIGSPVAFYALTSLYVVAIIGCYVISSSCMLWRRIYYPETLPFAQWSLGRWGVPVNAAAVVFGLWSFFWSFWPQSTPVIVSLFNWSSPIFVATIIISLIYYFVAGRKRYDGPVVLVEGRKRHMA